VLLVDPELLAPEKPSGCKAEASKGSSPLTPGSLRHRDFLTNEAKFKQIVQIDSDQILNQIHLVYRLNYLKDTAIARFVDDSVLQNINSLVYINSSDII
jgi:hypothetical protein